MVLFTKPDCPRCDWLKQNADLTDIEIQDVTNREGLGLLAYFECVQLAEKPGLPILVIPEKYGVEPITDFSEICQIFGTPEPDETCEGNICAL